MVSNTLVADDLPTNLATVQRPLVLSGAPLFVATSHGITWCVGHRAAAILLGGNHGR